MTTKLIDHLKKKNIAGFKEEVEKILNQKVLVKVADIKRGILESQSTEEIRDFFDFVGAEDYEEYEDYVSVIFPNKSTLNYALTQIDQFIPDLEYDIFYYADLGPEENPEIPHYPDLDDDEEVDIISVDWDEISDTEEDSAYELVIYKDIDESTPDTESDYSAYESFIPVMEGMKEGDTFTVSQLGKLKAEYGKITKIEPSSAHYKQLQKFVHELPKSAQKQLVDAGIPWLRGIANLKLAMRESFFGSSWEEKSLDYKHAQKEFGGRTPLWHTYNGKYYWIDGETGELYLAKEKAKPAGAKEYSGNPNKPIKEGYIGDKIDKLIDALFVSDIGEELSVAYNDQNKKAVDAILKKAKVNSVDINKIMAKMFGAHSRIATNESWQAIAKLSDSMLSGKHGADLKAAINAGDKKKVAEVASRYKGDNGFDMKYFNDAVESLKSFRGIPEANENERGRMIKRRVSYAKLRRGGKLVNKRQRRRKGKVSKGAGKGYRSKGAGWKTKLIQANRKRKISKRKNVKAQKRGKRFAARSRNIRKKLGFKSGT